MCKGATFAICGHEAGGLNPFLLVQVCGRQLLVVVNDALEIDVLSSEVLETLFRVLRISDGPLLLGELKQTEVLCQQFHSSPVGVIHEEAVAISSVRGDEGFLAFGFWLPTGIKPQLNLLIGINLHDSESYGSCIYWPKV